MHSIDKKENPKGTPPGVIGNPLTLTMRELATVLVKHFDLHDGRYDLLVEFQIGMGLFGPNPETTNPGAMVGVSKVGLIPSSPVDSPMTVDASLINPRPPAKKKASKS